MGLTTIVAEQTYVDVVHGLSYTPTIDQVLLTPQDDLGGREYWPSDAGPTTFRINISMPDPDEDHAFAWQIIPIVWSTPYGAHYGALETVKDLLNIDSDEDSFNEQIDSCLESADALINTVLDRCGATVPLTSPDSIIFSASNYLAAGLYKQKDVPDEKVHSFYTIGINLLNEYIADKYPGASLLPSVPTNPLETTNRTLAYNVGTAT